MMLTSRSASRSRRRDAEHWGAPPNSPPPPPTPDVKDVAEARSSEREEDRTVEAVDIALAAACAVASAEPRPRIALRLRTSAGVEVWVLSTEDGAAVVHRAAGEDADADVAAALECSLGTFLRLASNRLKMSRAVLSGLAKVPRAASPGARGNRRARAARRSRAIPRRHEAGHGQLLEGAAPRRRGRAPAVGGQLQALG
jgi:hypothetical protein